MKFARVLVCLFVPFIYIKIISRNMHTSSYCYFFISSHWTQFFPHTLTFCCRIFFKFAFHIEGPTLQKTMDRSALISKNWMRRTGEVELMLRSFKSQPWAKQASKGRRSCILTDNDFLLHLHHGKLASPLPPPCPLSGYFPWRVKRAFHVTNRLLTTPVSE